MTLRRPFLKWAGAKTKLVAAIREVAPVEAKRFIEPFAGSGAVGLNLGISNNILADANRDLVDVYRELKRDGEKFIDACGALFTGTNNAADAFYRLREEFNATTDRRRKACLFVYLNRHGYNGLCRYNSSGGYNVPFGRYDAPYFPRAEMLQFHDFLATCTLKSSDFRDVLAEAGEGDFVYCDPPYVPASKTANFTAYAKGGFGPKDQLELAAMCQEASRRGAHVVISNHDTPETRQLYEEADETIKLLVSRRISCDGDNRVKAKELLVVYRPAEILT
ncbi:MAG: Dam family site-specific DNA-(adenine-N6)-methyltransferase [Opitutaceae bacterium]